MLVPQQGLQGQHRRAGIEQAHFRSVHAACRHPKQWPEQLDVQGATCYTQSVWLEPSLELTGGMMYKVKGIYDGKKVVLLEPLPVPPDTSVEVSVTEEALDPEQVYWQGIVERGLIAKVRPLPLDEEPVSPVQAAGRPVSEIIIEERR